MTRGMETHQISPFIMVNVPKGVCSFVVGQPSDALIPHRLLDTAFARTISNHGDPFIYQYPTFQGPLTFRQDLAEYLSRTGRYPLLTLENLCITFGNSSALSFAISSLTRSGDTVIVEDPTYFLIGNIVRDAGLQVQRCRVDENDGLDMDDFEALVKSTKPSLVYVNPVHHNPTGSCLSVAKRERLIRLSIEQGFLIFSDEPYVLLSFRPDVIEEETSLATTASRIGGPAYQRLVCFGSFSKILSPGLRCGWISGHPAIVSRIAAHGSLVSGGGPASLISETIRQIITTGELEEHISFLRVELRERASAMCESLRDHFGPAASFLIPSGGYFVFLKLVACNDSDSFQAFLEATGVRVKILPSSVCSANPEGSTKRTCVRLAFSFYTPDEIKQGIATLAAAYTSFSQLG